MRAALDEETATRVAHTNDLRRAVGQALFGLHRALVFWRDRGKPFADVVRLWAASTSDLLARHESRLRRLEPRGEDAPLRALLASTLDRLALDLDRGDGGATPFLREVERRLAAVTDLLRKEPASSRVFDFVLVDRFRASCSRLARGPRSDAVAHVLDAARAVRAAS